MSYKPETPFDSIESAKQYVELLIESIEESRRDVEKDITRAERDGLERQRRALQLVSDKLLKLSKYMNISSRILNDLRILRRLLLEERKPIKQYPHREKP